MNKKNQDTLVDAAMKDPQRTAALLLVGINESLKVIATQMVRSNEDRDRFYREVLGVLTQAKDVEPGPCPEWSPVFSANEVQSCRLRAGHDGMHESHAGMAWDISGSLRSEQPAAAPVRPECGGCNHGDCPDCEA